MRRLIAAVFLAAFVAASAAPARQDVPSTSHPLSGYMEAWSAHDADRVAAYFTDDAVYEDVALGEVHRGKAAIKTFADGTFAELSGYAIEQKSLVVGDGSVAVEWVMTGTYRPTGTKFSVRGVSLMDLQGGKIRRNSDFWNMAVFLRQVGLASGSPS